MTTLFLGYIRIILPACVPDLGEGIADCNEYLLGDTKGNLNKPLIGLSKSAVCESKRHNLIIAKSSDDNPLNTSSTYVIVIPFSNVHTCNQKSHIVVETYTEDGILIERAVVNFANSL